MLFCIHKTFHSFLQSRSMEKAYPFYDMETTCLLKTLLKLWLRSIATRNPDCADLQPTTLAWLYHTPQCCVEAVCQAFWSMMLPTWPMTPMAGWLDPEAASGLHPILCHHYLVVANLGTTIDRNTTVLYVLHGLLGQLLSWRLWNCTSDYLILLMYLGSQLMLYWFLPLLKSKVKRLKMKPSKVNRKHEKQTFETILGANRTRAPKFLESKYKINSHDLILFLLNCSSLSMWIATRLAAARQWYKVVQALGFEIKHIPNCLKIIMMASEVGDLFCILAAAEASASLGFHPE